MPLSLLQYTREMHIPAMTSRANYILLQRNMESHFFMQRKKTLYFMAISASYIPPINKGWIYESLILEATSSFHRISQLCPPQFKFTRDCLLPTTFYLKPFSLHSQTTWLSGPGAFILQPTWGQVIAKHSLLGDVAASWLLGLLSLSPSYHPDDPLLSPLGLSSACS